MTLSLLGLALSSSLVWSSPPPRPVETAAPTEPTPPVLPADPSDGTAEVPAPEEPAPTETAPAQTAPAPSPEVEPLAPEVAPPAGPVPLEAESPLSPSVERQDTSGYVLVRAPRFRGTGLFIASGIMLSSAIIFQAVDSLMCGDCATGVMERFFLGGTMALAAGGGAVRGHADAYDDTALRRERPDTRRMLIVGAALTGGGALVGLVNEGMWWRCVFSNAGPYVDDGSFGQFDCRYGLTRGLLDFASVTTAAGLGMLTWSLAYRRDAKAYERARVVGLRPTFGRDRFGLSLGGRF